MRYLTSLLLFTGAAFAQEGVKGGPPTAKGLPGAQKQVPLPGKTEVGSPVDPTEGRKPDRETQLRIFAQAKKRKQEVERLEAQLERQRKRLVMVRQDVVNRYKALRMLQEELVVLTTDDEDERGGDLAEKDRAALEAERLSRVKKLSAQFNKMKADAGAKIVEQMDEQLAVDVLLRLKPRQAGKILGALKPEKAVKLTEQMTEVKRKKKRR